MILGISIEVSNRRRRRDSRFKKKLKASHMIPTTSSPVSIQQYINTCEATSFRFTSMRSRNPRGNDGEVSRGVETRERVL